MIWVWHFVYHIEGRTEAQRFRMFENWVLRTIFGPNSEKVAGYWRKLHNEELQNWYPQQIIFGLSSRKE
jgi:hypothetical protein